MLGEVLELGCLERLGVTEVGGDMLGVTERLGMSGVADGPRRSYDTQSWALLKAYDLGPACPVIANAVTTPIWIFIMIRTEARRKVAPAAWEPPRPQQGLSRRHRAAARRQPQATGPLPPRSFRRSRCAWVQCCL